MIALVGIGSGLAPPLPRSCVVDGPPKRRCVDDPLEAEPGRESLHDWHPRYAPAGRQTSQTTKPLVSELVAANRLFTQLVLRQVRPHDGSAVVAQPRIGASPKRRPDTMSVAAAGVGLSSTPIETLFRELARRRLRRLAAMEPPSS